MAHARELTWQDIEPSDDEPWAGGTSTLTTGTWNGQAVVVKEFDEEFLEDVDLEALIAMVAFATAAREDDEPFSSVANWPLALLKKGTEMVGVVLPLLDSSFMHVDDYEARARGLDLVGISAEFAQTTKRHYYSGPERVRILGEALTVLLTLHAADVVFNDVQPLNFAVNSDGTKVIALDCDSMWGPWGEPTAAIGPADYHIEGSRATRETDLVKFAHVAVRVLQTSLHEPVMQPHLLDQLIPPVQQQLLQASWNGAAIPASQWFALASSWTAVDQDGSLFVTSGGALTKWAPTVVPTSQLASKGVSASGGLSAKQWAALVAVIVTLLTLGLILSQLP
jgi:hypothetical protein